MSKFTEKKILIYNSSKGEIRINVNLDAETLWMNQAQIANLFDVDRTSITRHINNIFKTKELGRKSNVQKLHDANSDKPVSYYSLDVILSVGYRVNSKKATSFRIWATKTLSSYLSKGYVIDQKKLLGTYKKQLKELKDVVDFISNKANLPLLGGNEKELIEFLRRYAKSIQVLEEFDKGEFEILDYKTPKFDFNYENSLKVIENLREEVIKNNPENNLFGVDVDRRLKSILGSISQTFDTKELYSSIEEKASNLLYLIIKDHPFLDGNKRIASILFIYFLKQNDFFYDKSGKEKFDENGIITLSLLVAQSNPKEKELMINLIIRLLQ